MAEASCKTVDLPKALLANDLVDPLQLLQLERVYVSVAPNTDMVLHEVPLFDGVLGLRAETLDLRVQILS